MSDDEGMSAVDVETDDNDGEYHPRGLSIPPPESLPLGKQQRKRGRKPNPNQSVRSAREAARKANHSVIEYAPFIFFRQSPFCHPSPLTPQLQGKRDERRSTKR